jgi:hypothetical protein
MPNLADSLSILASPAILFFVLGVGAALARSDLAIPEPVTKTFSLYLMLCIGFKGGVEARVAGLSGDFAVAAVLGLSLSALLPLAAWPILRRFTRLDGASAGALAAAYGSVSVITFAAAQEHLASLGLQTSGFMAAVLALMEAPAILTALILINGRASGAAPRSEVIRHALLGSAGVMLLGSFAIGLISGDAGLAKLDTFVGPLFQGVLCLFLLELGLQAARGLMSGGGRLSRGVLTFAVAFPVAAGLGVLAGSLALGMQTGDAVLQAVLAGSASYIAVPAAMRLAVPTADPAVYMTAPLALTFPFNLLIGIPAYAALAKPLAGLVP